mgnify:CR=1 FL=1
MCSSWNTTPPIMDGWMGTKNREGTGSPVFVFSMFLCAAFAATDDVTDDAAAADDADASMCCKHAADTNSCGMQHQLP